MGDEGDLDRLVKRIHRELRREATPAQPDDDALEARLREIRGPGDGGRGVANFFGGIVLASVVVFALLFFALPR